MPGRVSVPAVCSALEAQRGDGGEGESRVRGESVETTGFQLPQTVLPVGSRNTEVMDRASQDSERFPLQSEVGRVSLETLNATHSAVLRRIPAGQHVHKHYNKQVMRNS